MTARLAAAALLLASGCAAGPARPVDIDLAHDTCSSCRMVISSRATASQIVAPGEEPRLFDDFACLRKGLADSAPPPEAAIFVADHVTGEWTRAEQAVFTAVSTLQTPMGSGVMAHRDSRARDQDPASAGGRPMTLAEALGRSWP